MIYEINHNYMNYGNELKMKKMIVAVNAIYAIA